MRDRGNVGWAGGVSTIRAAFAPQTRLVMLRVCDFLKGARGNVLVDQRHYL
jgi:hypothetical protein